MVKAVIREHKALYVWAERADGLRSEHCPVPVGWEFR